MKNMLTQMKNHLRGNRGDGYIWFLAISVVLLLTFGALFTVMSTSMHMRDVRNNVDAAAMDVFVAMREQYYGKLTDGNTSFTKSNLSDIDVLESMAGHLNAECNVSDLHPYIEKRDHSGRLLYRITSFTYEYIESVTVPIQNASGQLTGYTLLGDVNGDGKCDDRDLSIGLDYNKNGNIDDKEVLLMKALIKYFDEHPNESNVDITERSSSILIIAFQIEVPITFGTVDFGNKVEDCAYYSSFSFIPAM